MKKLLLTTTLLCAAFTAMAQDCAAYYSDATGKKGAALKTSLFNIISNHEKRSYGDLWTDFKSTDSRADGKVWDMYSCTTNFEWGTHQDRGSGGSKEGEFYNREHSFPNSWFGGVKSHPAYTDLFHMYPTDKLVNNRRSNYPFGDVQNPSWTSNNGFSKLGPCSSAGYSGTAFEPADEYKGDFARTYFYMATAYESEFASWADYGDSEAMLAGNAYPGYKQWAINVLLRWAAEDPVSEKETERNKAVYGIQGNRNPFIDYPGLEQYVWGELQNEAFSADAYLTPEQITSIFEVSADDADVVVYDLSGRRVSTTADHGIYVVGGRKVMK